MSEAYTEAPDDTSSLAKVMVILVIRPPSLGPYSTHVQFLRFAVRDTLLVIYTSSISGLWRGLVAHDGGRRARG